ncbi:hypothetical protein BGW39_010766 [Mortierella sp. 14UC]|nr:hypothetical protein BGW39_010766 [Mortierella sp. 14UC]
MTPGSVLQPGLSTGGLSSLLRLTHLDVGHAKDKGYESIPSRIGRRRKYRFLNYSQVAHLSWLVLLNTNLTHLTLRLRLNYKFTHSIDIRCFVHAISSLPRLKSLKVHFFPSDVTAFRALVMSCPASLETLMLKPSKYFFRNEVFRPAPQDDLDWTDGPIVLRQQGPLLHIKKLILQVKRSVDPVLYTHMLEICANLDTLEIVLQERDCRGIMDAVVPTVVQYCRHLRHYYFRPGGTMDEEDGSALRFLGKLPPETLETLHYEWYDILDERYWMDDEGNVSDSYYAEAFKILSIRPSRTSIGYLVSEKWACQNVWHLEFQTTINLFKIKKPLTRRQRRAMGLEKYKELKDKELKDKELKDKEIEDKAD